MKFFILFFLIVLFITPDAVAADRVVVIPLNGKSSSFWYSTVTSATGRVWMDRNLGASQVATSSTDLSARGDLYQWGRLVDGHERRVSTSTTTLSSSYIPGHGKFIKNQVDPFDWLTKRNNNLWQGVSGINNPCPPGFRLPTNAEWGTERQSWSYNNSAGAFASPLKFVLAGYRSFNDLILGEGSTGAYWSSTVSASKSWYLNIGTGSAHSYVSGRSQALSVRCIKN